MQLEFMANTALFITTCELIFKLIMEKKNSWPTSQSDKLMMSSKSSLEVLAIIIVASIICILGELLDEIKEELCKVEALSERIDKLEQKIGGTLIVFAFEHT